jgi:hypothetical protein
VFHRSFQSALNSGHRAERAWVDDLRSAGRSAAHGRKLVIKGHNKNKDHCETPDAVVLLSLEIKERSISFTCPEDYPYETVFVDDMHGLAKETLKHFAYIYKSKPTGKWVWITPLDRDDQWTEQVVFDRGRKHDVPMLVAPKSCLRSADELTKLLYPHQLLEFVDGDTGIFISGGGASEAVNKTDPAARGRGRKAPGKADRNVG